jgi:hypothetical protein
LNLLNWRSTVQYLVRPFVGVVVSESPDPPLSAGPTVLFEVGYHPAAETLAALAPLTAGVGLFQHLTQARRL